MNITKKFGISVKNDWWYTNLAALFDNEEFYNDVISLRSKFDITKPMNLKNRIVWFNEVIRQECDPDLLAMWQVGDTKEMIYFRPKTTFEKEIDMIRMKYHRPECFFTPIMNAVLCHKHTDNKIDINTANVFIMNTDDHVKEPKLMISITPATTLKELIAIFKNKIPAYKQEYIRVVTKDKLKIIDIKPCIREHRKMYWLYRKYHSYQKVADMLPGVTRQSVINAIKDYKKLIS